MQVSIKNMSLSYEFFDKSRMSYNKDKNQILPEEQNSIFNFVNLNTKIVTSLKPLSIIIEDSSIYGSFIFTTNNGIIGISI